MVDEYNALMANDTWDLVPPLVLQNLVGCKCVYIVKYHSIDPGKGIKRVWLLRGFISR